MAISNINIIELKSGPEKYVIGKIKYTTSSHYYVQRLDKGTTLRIKKERIKSIKTIEEIHQMVQNHESINDINRVMLEVSVIDPPLFNT